MDIRQSRLAFNNTLQIPDEHSFGVFKMLEDVYPAFSKKLFEGNDIMQALVMSGHNPMDIMEYPICGSCETLAPYNGYAIKDGKYVPKCTCMKEKCGKTTINPITLKTWAKYELKKKAPPEYVEAMDYAIDMIAMNMMLKHKNELARAIMKEKAIKDEKGLLVNNEIPNGIPEIEHHREGTEELEKEYSELEGEQEDV